MRRQFLIYLSFFATLQSCKLYCDTYKDKEEIDFEQAPYVAMFTILSNNKSIFSNNINRVHINFNTGEK